MYSKYAFKLYRQHSSLMKFKLLFNFCEKLVICPAAGILVWLYYVVCHRENQYIFYPSSIQENKTGNVRINVIFRGVRVTIVAVEKQ